MSYKLWKVRRGVRRLDAVLNNIPPTGIENRNHRVKPDTGAWSKIFKKKPKTPITRSPVRTKLSAPRRLSECWNEDDRHDVTGTWDGHVYTAPLERRVLRSAKSSSSSFQSLA